MHSTASLSGAMSHIGDVLKIYRRILGCCNDCGAPLALSGSSRDPRWSSNLIKDYSRLF